MYNRIGTTLKLSERPLMGNSEVRSDIWLPPDASRQPLPPYIHIGQVDYVSICKIVYVNLNFIFSLLYYIFNKINISDVKCYDFIIYFVFDVFFHFHKLYLIFI